MPKSHVLEWLIGTKPPPPKAQTEAVEQLERLFGASDTGAEPPDEGAPSRGQKWIVSAYRDFRHQEAIWLRKLDFQGRAFDKISDDARRVCGTLIKPEEIRWDPAMPQHRACWGIGALPYAPNPPLPNGARSLTDDERQREILQASAAPGLSRHHWGTDFDLFDRDLDPISWEPGGRFWPALLWLRNQAFGYGFVNPFPASIPSGVGHMPEPWHWSYWPISRPLWEFARAHQADLEEALSARWREEPCFSFVRHHWREYLLTGTDDAQSYEVDA